MSFISQRYVAVYSNQKETKEVDCDMRGINVNTNAYIQTRRNRVQICEFECVCHSPMPCTPSYKITSPCLPLHTTRALTVVVRITPEDKQLVVGRREAVGISG